jgi:acetoin utilization deacetylase AcuC-like enzyme
MKVAIVDFDIHHGNGTEDIIKNVKPRMVPLPLPASWPQAR